MDLRDQLAMHFAAALVGAFHGSDQIARRAYDLAEAMLAERDRRIDAEEERAIATEPRLDTSAPVVEPEPAYPTYDEEVEPRWLEPPYDPSWDMDPRWSAEDRERPGLARTQAEEEALRKERSA